MNALTFFLLSAFICGSVHVAPCNGQIGVPSLFNPNSFVNLTGEIVQLFENNAQQLQQSFTAQVQSVFQMILTEICNIFGGIINLFDLPLRAWCQANESPIPPTNPRGRRSLIPTPSSLTSSLTNLVPLPSSLTSSLTNLVPTPFQPIVNSLQSVNLTEIIENPVGLLTSGMISQIEAAINGTIPVITRFISTELLPQTRVLLDSLERTNRLPPSISMLIQNFDLIYNILQGLGYVSPVPR